MRVEPEQLKLFLLDAGIIKEKEFEEIEKKAQETNKNLDDVLISRGVIKEEELIRLKAYILGIPFINLVKEIIPKDVLSIIPESLAKTYDIVAFRKKEGNLEVAMLDPDNLRAIDFIKKKSGLKILPRLTDPESIKNALTQYRKTLSFEFKELIKEEVR